MIYVINYKLNQLDFSTNFAYIYERKVSLKIRCPISHGSFCSFHMFFILPPCRKTQIFIALIILAPYFYWCQYWFFSTENFPVLRVERLRLRGDERKIRWPLQLLSPLSRKSVNVVLNRIIPARPELKKPPESKGRESCAIQILRKSNCLLGVHS